MEHEQQSQLEAEAKQAADEAQKVRKGQGQGRAADTAGKFARAGTGATVQAGTSLGRSALLLARLLTRMDSA